MEVQRQRLRFRAPNADVVAGLSAAGQIEVELHAEFFLGHDQLPEQTVTRSLPGHRPMPEVVGGAEPVAQLPGGGHKRRSSSSLRSASSPARVTAPAPVGSPARCVSSAPAALVLGRGYPPPARTETSCFPGCAPTRSWWISCCRRSFPRSFRLTRSLLRARCPSR